MSRRYRCGVGISVKYVCAREHQPCSELCLCFPERCINKGLEEFQDAEEKVEIEQVIMDPDVRNSALVALAANRQQQQQHQVQKHHDMLTALAIRLLAVLAPTLVVAPAQATPVAASTGCLRYGR